MEPMAVAAAALLPDDVILEVLLRVSTDIATLFRCAATCKRWRALVADRSFLWRCLSENAGHSSSFPGFISVQQGRGFHIRNSQPPVFVLPPGSALSKRCHFLTSLVPGAPDGLLNGAEPLVERHGLLLVRLRRGVHHDSVHMAACNLRTGTCDVLPPLECGVTSVNCSVLTNEDDPSFQRERSGLTPFLGYSFFFKVLAIIISGNESNNDMEFNVYTFSSSESSWSAPRKCFDKTWGLRKNCFSFHRWNEIAVVYHSVAHWLVRTFSEHYWESSKYYTFQVSAKTDRTSLREISILGNRLYTRHSIDMPPILSIDVDGSLSMFSWHPEPSMWWVDIWTRENDVDSGVWLHNRVVRLNVPRKPKFPRCYAHMSSAERSGTFLIVDDSRLVRRVNIEAETIEDEQFQDCLGLAAVPVGSNLLALFASLHD